jgi:hypothetical protein
MVIEGLEMLKQPEEVGEHLQDDMLERYKKDEETLKANLALAMENIQVVDSDEEEFQDPVNGEEEENNNEDQEDEGASNDLQGTYNLEDDEEVDSDYMDEDESESNTDTESGMEAPYSLQEESEILDWDTQQNVEQRMLLQQTFRVSQPHDFKDQLSNEAGPTLSGMIMKCYQLEQEMGSMSQGQDRDPARFSNKLFQELLKEAGSSENNAMLEKVVEVREKLELSYQEGVIKTNTSRNATINKVFKFGEWEKEVTNKDGMAPTGARKTRSGDRLTESRAEND